MPSCRRARTRRSPSTPRALSTPSHTVSSLSSSRFFFFFKQKTAYEMVYSDWSSDVCSSDLSRAYAVGFNGLYLNLKDREAGGIVEKADRDRLLEEIRTKLLALRDDEAHG